jgi:FkbM family methyltransferase
MININTYNLGNYIVPQDTADGICIDIGCNVGSFMQKYVYHFKKIYYYEPITSCYEICQKFSNNYNHIYGNNLAVWSESNKNINILAHFNNDSGSSALECEILNEEWGHKNVIQSVNTISLHDILQHINSEVDYCKCDCENSEYFIFLNNDISKIKYIGMEIHWQMGQKKQNELIEYISQTHNLVNGSSNFTNYNREILFQRKI